MAVRDMVQVKRRMEFMGIWLRQFCCIAVGLLVYILPRILESVITLKNGWEARFFVEYKAESGSDVSDQLTFIYCMCFAALIFLGDTTIYQVIKRVVFKGRINNNDTIKFEQPALKQDPVLKDYVENTWRIAVILPVLWGGTGSIWWSIVNLPFGIVSSYFLVPILYFAKPLGKKYIVSNLVIIGILIASIYFGFQLYERLFIDLQMNWFRMIKTLLTMHACKSLDLYAFICFTVIPTILMIKNCLHYTVYDLF
jgi:hypothetical protein